MEHRIFTVSLPKNPLIAIKVIPGHFATANSHISHYLDMSQLKSNASIAKDAAKELAMPYLTKVLVDAIVCMDSTEIIGAYLAEELLQDGTSVMNSGREIHIVSPRYNVNRKLIFQSNVQEIIKEKNVILLVASASSGRTVSSALECIEYYGGKLVGISSLFSTMPENARQEVSTLFASHDIPGYQSFASGDCALCKKGCPLEAIVNSEGYTSISI